MYSHFRSDGTNNNGGYKSPKVDELLATARSATELAARKTAYQDAQKQIMDDAAYIFINHNVAIQCSTKKLQGFVLLPDSLMRFTGVWLG
jgi:peptide/nickel transport system substrate-binding protein